MEAVFRKPVFRPILWEIKRCSFLSGFAPLFQIIIRETRLVAFYVPNDVEGKKGQDRYMVY